MVEVVKSKAASNSKRNAYRRARQDSAAGLESHSKTARTYAGRE